MSCAPQTVGSTLCVQTHHSLISQSMPSGNSFSIPRHPQLIFMLAPRFHNKHKPFVSIVFSPYSAMTLFIGPQAPLGVMYEQHTAMHIKYKQSNTSNVFGGMGCCTEDMGHIG